jgi:hypothetical protein
MSQFYGDMQGNRGQTTRCGTKTSGLTAHIRGWNIGVKTVCHIDKNGNDVIDVFQTGGSNHLDSTKLIATISAQD